MNVCFDVVSEIIGFEGFCLFVLLGFFSFLALNFIIPPEHLFRAGVSMNRK